MLLVGQMTESREYAHRTMLSSIKSQSAYSYFGNIEIDFGHGGKNVSDYMRWLDTKDGTAGVEYNYGGVTYSRDYVASYPAGVLLSRFSADKQGTLHLNITMSGKVNKTVTASANDTTVTLRGSSGQSTNPILWTGTARFVPDKKATVKTSGSNLIINNATTVDLFFDAETNYRYPTREAWEAEVKRKVDAAVSKGYPESRKEAIADSSGLLGRVELDLGTSPNSWASRPTDERIGNARTGLDDIQFVTLLFNFARHLLAGSSRPSLDNTIALPANLQGIWNNDTIAPWGGKYTININIEMNYWIAGPTNMIDTELPLYDLVKVAVPRGQDIAKRMYGCEGTVFHHNLDLWGDAAPTDNYTSSSLWPMGSAWLGWQAIDHYRFTQDKTFLKNVVYPFLSEATKFYQCYTFEHNGYNVTGPSLSPENTFRVPANWTVAGAKEAVDINPMMDGQLMEEVFKGLLEAASELGIVDSDPAVKAAKDFLPTIMPQQIGSLGQILEWRIEYTEAAIGQKHLSPLFALSPGRAFAPLVNSTLFKAAEVLLDRRVSHGSGGTGWSRTWLINSFARALRGDDAWKQLEKWYAVFPPGDSLYNTDTGNSKGVDIWTFQIDGNFGLASGVVEMILQSHAGLVHILPALPGALPRGSVRGLVARGNFEVDIEWGDGELVKASVLSRSGATLDVRVGDGEKIEIDGQSYKGAIETLKGKTYRVKLISQTKK
ncbi:glycoside hydrolase family 95 protein [Byssothecium circinans]|uniref:Glycoside hydrolase family 95 protein n=1 Tax=Byssothecium circinans TaxID=147558 RepID=A0A6A5TRS4_9PLEO|nr:glycoside hydrolase family 95 protein [Byssothecium circinans]